MTRLRALILGHKAVAIAMIAVALAVKALIPAGFMPSRAGQAFMIELCWDGANDPGPVRIALPMKGDAGDPAVQADMKAKSGCLFTGLAMAATAGVDALLLAIAIAYVMALGLRPVAPVLRRHGPGLRPPLRGPPLTV
ncbi:hypothetical protein GVO57_00955 [Sphingomonas changnyeongensis]|uniref:DUF2946 domain-containing protein n=1 Tax=Sphingomonas changnyeongensis TaxID=2698679 RepID=A0A7Z2NUG6_9SPHN|nr:hypothetical protein [Sphingomonas changnyeongensis]QHL89649.1 hypothetical protein GVO57_00955 [Sphingomonas changnyeongensis]